jgi:hypothetical protein
MLKACLLLLMNLVFAAIAMAQNLVPNWSFEDSAYCTTANNPILVAPPWFSANYATPDVYSMELTEPCAVAMDTTEFIGIVCYQGPFDGIRFAGAHLWMQDHELKEYMEVQLTAPLEAGHTYTVSMEISLTECYRYAIDRVGAYFAQDTVFDPDLVDMGALPVTPQAQFHDPGFYTNTTDWIHLEDTIVADGGERFMVIGSFTDEASTNVFAVSGNMAEAAYYYFDAVQVVDITNPESIPEALLIVNDPNGLGLLWSGTHGIDRVVLMDMMGRVVMEVVTDGKERATLVLPQTLATGTYVVQVFSSRQVAKAKWTRTE